MLLCMLTTRDSLLSTPLHHSDATAAHKRTRLSNCRPSCWTLHYSTANSWTLLPQRWRHTSSLQTLPSRHSSRKRRKLSCKCTFQMCWDPGPVSPLELIIHLWHLWSISLCASLSLSLSVCLSVSLSLSLFSHFRTIAIARTHNTQHNTHTHTYTHTTAVRSAMLLN